MKFVYSILFLIFTCLTDSTSNAQILAAASSEDDNTAVTKNATPCTRVIFESFRNTEWTIKGQPVSVLAEQISMTQFLGTSAKWFFPSPERGEILEVTTTDAKGKVLSVKRYDFYSITPSLLTFNNYTILANLRKKVVTDTRNTIEP